MYWDRVVQEVLNKDNPNYRFMYTMGRGEQTASAADQSDNQIDQKNGGSNGEGNGRGGQRRKNKRYSLGEKFPGVLFTRREAECMLEFLKGKTIVGVAQTLDISHRTVEFYLKKMKHKLNCQSKHELIDKVLSSDLCKNVDF